MYLHSKWIKAPAMPGTVVPEFRREFSLCRPVKKAVATVTALGIYNLHINGEKAGNALFAPGWTSYRNHIQEQTYDITALLKEDNTVSIPVGNGWACGYLGWTNRHHIFADNVALIADIELEYEDGTTEHIVTDESWQVYTSQILYSEFYHGEILDRTASTEYVGNALEDTSATGRIIPQLGECILEQERLAAREVILTPKGERVIDFGQNMAGYVEIRVRGNRGDRIVVSHAEVLDKDGNFYTANLRKARNVNTYVLSGEGEEIFKPTFSFQGFRYIRLDEFPHDDIDPDDFTAIAVYSDLRRTGHFYCGHEKINQLYSNTLWSQRSNFLEVPTDCPQRDERLGWTGDAAVFCRTAAINYDVERFFRKWLLDMATEQRDDGAINCVVPRIFEIDERVSAAWADVCVIAPWELYLAYGDVSFLRQNFDMMKKWIGYMHAFGEDEFLWVGDYHYGDWLAMDAGDGQVLGATQTDFIGSAYFAFSTGMVCRIGHILGEDVSEYEELYRNVRSAFRAAYMKDGLPCLYPKGDGFANNRRVNNLTMTGISLILRFGLYEESERQGLVDMLAKLIADFDGRMTTGFVGTPHILHALSENGRTDLAYDLLLQEKAPSWLFSVNQGATTIWEHWDSLKEDGSFWSTAMNSFNHYSYGSVFDWIYGVALGITVDEAGVGYEAVTIAPNPDRRLGFACGSIDTKYGTVSVSWRYLGLTLRYEIEIPQGMRATLKLAGKIPQVLAGGKYQFVV